jgi:predicted Rossmann fold nucleotide-binding protein DprA/Smf involved in DNA uptake
MSHEDLKRKAVTAVNQANKAVTADFISYKTGLAWASTKALLLEAALEGKIKALETSRGYVFLPAERVST